MRRLLLAAALAIAVILSVPGTASAHAVLEETTPGSGEQLDVPPPAVVLRFSEPVEASLGAIRLFDSNGDRVDDGAVEHPGGEADTVSLDVPRDLGDGSYVVTWRVISADSHPVHGAFTFQVGDVATGNSQALARQLLAADGGDSLVGALYATVRFLAFVSLVVLVGAAAFLVIAWPAGGGSGSARRLLWAAWAVCAGATVLGIGAQGAYAGALPLGDVVDPSVISSVFDTRYGHVELLRLLLLTAAVPALWTLLRPRSDDRHLGAAPLVAFGLLGAALLLTPGLAGHAATGDLIPLALVADLLHVGGVALWFGGLVVLTVCVLPRADVAELADVVPRFSTLAFGSVIAIVVSGTFQAWRQVGSYEALTTTTYGRLLLLKVGLFVVMVFLGNLGRRWVHRHYAVEAADRIPVTVGGGPKPNDDDPADEIDDADEAWELLRFRRSVGAEVLLGLAILAVTALLVNAQPARSAVALPYSAELRTDDLLIDLTVDPAKAGNTEVHVYTLDPTGAVQDVQEVTVDLTLPSEDIGPLRVPLERAGPGHFSAYDFNLPIAGDWELKVSALIDEFTQVSATDTIHVRG